VGDEINFFIGTPSMKPNSKQKREKSWANATFSRSKRKGSVYEKKHA